MPMQTSASENEPEKTSQDGFDRFADGHGENQARPLRLADRAIADLRFIRSAMERSGRFTAVPGLSWMIMGAMACVGALIAAQQSSPENWLLTWVGAGVAGLAVGIRGIQLKSKSEGRRSILSGPGRMFVLGFGPSLAAAIALSAALVLKGHWDLIPGVWLLCYGAAVMSGGSISIPIVPLAGMCFMGLGLVALVAGPQWHDWLLAIGFGGIHGGFGFIVWRRYGG